MRSASVLLFERCSIITLKFLSDKSSGGFAMGTRNVTKEKIVEALNELPQERLSEVSDFIAFLRFKSDREPRQLIQLGGVWSDYPPVTEEEIAEARAEMWGQFGERKL